MMIPAGPPDNICLTPGNYFEYNTTIIHVFKLYSGKKSNLKFKFLEIINVFFNSLIALCQ